MKFLVLTLAILTVGKPTQSVDDNSGRYQITLPPGARIIRFSTFEREHILDVHNNLRNNKKGCGCASSAKSNKLAWDNDLAELAIWNAKEIANGKYNGTDSEKFQNFAFGLGYIQSIANQGASNRSTTNGFTTNRSTTNRITTNRSTADQCTFNRAAVLKKFDTMIGDWFTVNQNADSHFTFIRNAQQAEEDRFTKILNSTGTGVGCAGVFYTAGQPRDIYYFVCNYVESNTNTTAPSNVTISYI